MACVTDLPVIASTRRVCGNLNTRGEIAILAMTHPNLYYWEEERRGDRGVRSPTPALRALLRPAASAHSDGRLGRPRCLPGRSRPLLVVARPWRLGPHGEGDGFRTGKRWISEGLEVRSKGGKG